MTTPFCTLPVVRSFASAPLRPKFGFSTGSLGLSGSCSSSSSCLPHLSIHPFTHTSGNQQNDPRSVIIRHTGHLLHEVREVLGLLLLVAAAVRGWRRHRPRAPPLRSSGERRLALRVVARGTTVDVTTRVRARAAAILLLRPATSASVTRRGPRASGASWWRRGPGARAREAVARHLRCSISLRSD